MVQRQEGGLITSCFGGMSEDGGEVTGQDEAERALAGSGGEVRLDCWKDLLQLSL